MARNALNHEIHDIVRKVGFASEAVLREDWPTAQKSLAEAQRLIAHLLGEIEMTVARKRWEPRGGRGKG